MKHKYLFGILVFVLCLCFYLFHLIYEDAKNNAIIELNSRQLIHAKQAKSGIEEFFENLIAFLSKLSESRPVAQLSDQGKQLIDFSLSTHPKTITAITRVDPAGRILYTTPRHEAAIGKDISSQKHIQEILRTHKPVVSDVFKAVQGYRAVAVHVPIFKNGKFAGTIGALVDFQTIAKAFLEDIRLGETGYAWMTSGKGIELYCPVPGHTGNSVFENCKDFPTIISMAKNMLKGKQGTDTYLFDRVRGEDVVKVKKHAVYLPIKVGDGSWSIVVASSEKEVLANVVSFKNKLIIIGLLLLLCSALFSYYAMKSWGIVREARKRQETEKALRESEKKYRRLVDNAVLGFYQVAKEGGFQFVNQKMAEMFGYETTEEFLGEVKNITELYERPEERAVVLGEMDEDGFIHGRELEFRKKDGEIIWVSLYARRLDEKGRIFYEGLMEDITQTKTTQARLAKGEKELKWLFKSMINAFVLFDSVFDEGGRFVSYRFVFINEAYEAITGVKNEEVRGRTVHEVWPGTEESWIEKYGEVAVTGIPQTFEMYHGPTQKLYHCNVYRPWDTPDRFCVIFDDITERKQIEDQLRHAQKMESIGVLAGGVAHDFNNILSIILGNAELAMDDVPDWNPTFGFLNEIRSATLRAKDVVQELLSFSRKSEERRKPLEFCQLVKESMRVLRTTIPTSVEFSLHIPDASYYIHADPTQINQILMNLASNAADAMRQLGGTLEVALQLEDLDERDVEMDLEPGNYVKLSVKDTGEGIETKNLDRIFDPYFTTKEVGKGTGMGLAVVYGIVKRHGGGIRVRTEIGKGTTFEFFFPSIDLRPEPEEKPEHELPGGSEKILFVDDEPSMAKLNQQRLERLGYKVVAMTDPTEALEIFLKNPEEYDLIITDMTMPKMTGDRLAKAILKIRPHMPIILCTGYSERLSKESAHEIGVRKYIEKPISKENLARSVREVLDKPST